MYPELFHIGSLPIRSYGVFLASAFFLGVLYVRLVTKRDNQPFEHYLLISYVLIFGGVIGARLAYVLMHLDEFADDWTASFNPFAQGQFGIAGLNLYGGVVAAIALSILFIRIRRMPVMRTLDYFAPALGLGLFLGRIGCFCNGCCFGNVTDLPWGISYPVGTIPWFVFGNQLLHPSQLYSALYGLGLFLGMHYLLGKKRFDGQVAAVFLIVEAVFRFAIEGVRYYEDQMYVSIGSLHPTINHIISVGLFAFGSLLYWWGWHRKAAQVSLS